MGKKTSVQVAAVIFILMIWGVWSWGGGQVEKANPAVPSIRTVETHVSDAYTKTDASYPQFAGAAEELNARIAKTVEGAIAEHRKASAENYAARLATARPGENIPAVPAEDDTWEFYGQWAVAQANGEFVSGLVRYGAFSGGAHGYENVATFNWDVKNKKEVALGDLFPGDPAWTEKVSAAAIAALEVQILGAVPPLQDNATDEEKKAEQDYRDNLSAMIRTGAGPDAENFKNFTFSGNTATVYFAQYQVGPYAIGMPTVDIALPPRQK